MIQRVCCRIIKKARPVFYGKNLTGEKMKKSIVLALVLLFAFCAGVFAEVRIGGHTVSDEAYIGAKGLGIGIVLGETNGLSVKDWISRNHALSSTRIGTLITVQSGWAWPT
jgi:hypothetical protein